MGSPHINYYSNMNSCNRRWKGGWVSFHRLTLNCKCSGRFGLESQTEASRKMVFQAQLLLCAPAAFLSWQPGRHRVPEWGQLTLGVSATLSQHREYLMWFAMEYSSIYLQRIEINITNLAPSKDVKQINLPETNFYGRRLIFKWLLQYKLIHNNHLKFWSALQISTLYNAMSMKSLYNIPLECCIFLMHSWYFQEIIFTVINNCWFIQSN